MGAVSARRFRRLRHNTARSDVLAADEAQPVEALLVGEVDSFCALVHLSPNTVRQSRQAIENSYGVRAIIRQI
jgi:hypothetical protein